MNVRVILSIGSILLILIGIYWWGLRTPTKDLHDVAIQPASKPVVLLVIDSLMEQPLQSVIREGKAPALEFLMKQGHYYPDIITSYPTMSVTIDSTLLTGQYADGHRLPGLIWYSKDENRLINYGTGKREIIKQGIRQTIKDGLTNLNQSHLNRDSFTIYEDLANAGLSSASINGLVYRGDTSHRLHIPKLATVTKLIQPTETEGPPILSFGGLSKYNEQNNLSNKLWKSFGVNDSFTANELRYLIAEDKLPAFTLAYFPDMDKPIHQKGPSDLNSIAKTDKQIQTILNSFGTWEEAVQNVIWIVYGDSGQSPIQKERKTALIDLPSLFKSYRITDVQGTPDDDLAFAVNERMAYIYLMNDEIKLSNLIDRLKQDERIGFIAWKEVDQNYVLAPGNAGLLTFSPGGQFTDSFNQSWQIDGDPSILDITLAGNSMQYGKYPDAFARLHGSLHSHEGRFIVVDAKPGYEFIGKHSPIHLGGAGHGSLHQDDSVTPLLVVGTDRKPEYNRLVDFKNWILELTIKEGE